MQTHVGRHYIYAEADIHTQHTFDPVILTFDIRPLKQGRVVSQDQRLSHKLHNRSAHLRQLDIHDAPTERTRGSANQTSEVIFQLIRDIFCN